MSSFDTFNRPWVPLEKDGQTQLVSLRHALEFAHDFDGISASLAPVEIEGLLRFLTSVAAVALRSTNGDTAFADEAVRERRIPTAAIDAFATTYPDRFDLADPDRPFLQEWHATVAADEKSANRVAQLHVHVPGASSSTWCLRNETRPATDPAVLTLLLVTLWFHGKPSNSGWPASVYAGKAISGAPSGGAWDTSFHLAGTTLAETLLLNVLDDWVVSDPTLPAWLDQQAVPTLPVLVGYPTCLWRTTWTPNRPLIIWEHGVPTRYVLGLTKQPIPQVAGQTAQEAAKGMHTDDYAHVWYDDAKEGKDPEIKQVYAPERFLSTEGALYWYTKGYDKPMRGWGSNRTLPKCDAIAVCFHNERGDTYGNRSWSEWVSVPVGLMTVTGPPIPPSWLSSPTPTPSNSSSGDLSPLPPTTATRSPRSSRKSAEPSSPPSTQWSWASSPRGATEPHPTPKPPAKPSPRSPSPYCTTTRRHSPPPQRPSASRKPAPTSPEPSETNSPRSSPAPQHLPIPRPPRRSRKPPQPPCFPSEQKAANVTSIDIAPADTPTPAPDWRGLIAEVLARRDSTHSGGYRSAMAAARIPATEVNALAYTERFLSALNRDQKIGARRAAGICAATSGAHQPRPDETGKHPYLPIGQSLRNLYIAVNGTNPASLDGKGNVVHNALLAQVNSLPMLDVELAAATFGLLIDRCAAKHINVNYFDLARTLIHWGNGITLQSRDTRSAVLTAFYTPSR